MPITDDLDLPIKKLKINGPAVDSHHNRKESDNDSPMTNERLMSNYDRVKDRNLAALKEFCDK